MLSLLAPLKIRIQYLLFDGSLVCSCDFVLNFWIFLFLSVFVLQTIRQRTFTFLEYPRFTGRAQIYSHLAFEYSPINCQLGCLNGPLGRTHPHFGSVVFFNFESFCFSMISSAICILRAITIELDQRKWIINLESIWPWSRYAKLGIQCFLSHRLELRLQF